MYVKQDFDFNDLRNNCWGQATQILEEIADADKEDALMNYLEEIFYDEIPDLTEVNDILAYDWENVYEAIGLSNWSLEDNLDIDEVNTIINRINDYTDGANRYLTVSDVYDYEEDMTEADKSGVINEVESLMANLRTQLEYLKDSDESDYDDNLADAQNAAEELDDYINEHLESEAADKIFDDITSSISNW